MIEYHPWFDTITVEAWRYMSQNSYEQAMLKQVQRPYNPATPPGADAYLDLSQIKGTDVYHFTSLNDLTCSAAQAATLESIIPTFVDKKEYGCDSSHEWFTVRGMGQKQFIQDVVDALNEPVLNTAELPPADTGSGASQLALSAFAAIVASALVM